jgi:hypothetical protein
MPRVIAGLPVMGRQMDERPGTGWALAVQLAEADDFAAEPLTSADNVVGERGNLAENLAR